MRVRVERNGGRYTVYLLDSSGQIKDKFEVDEVFLDGKPAPHLVTTDVKSWMVYDLGGKTAMILRS
ncbi:hypothetical protein [Thermofilum pendens]|uniref:Uncharacterized protein n=1 Tax=Thermofilum pendens (strain DSM 2475 / Hrk 5) TaxID=368408 RepID=A1S1E7_THEPD|nr:hypothetical protein [Thermofilum pendens]ABL79277.1 hypothetical protein Tpen_1882 [Thermofilum pendens Hrk 5]